jgi:hypothetical protein
MNAHYKTLPAIAGTSSILIIAAFLTVSARLPWSRLTTHYEAPAAVPADVAVDVAVPRQAAPSQFQSPDALSDIRAYAAHHLGPHTEVPGSFGGTHQWSADWHLQWLDVEHDGEVVRIYHATDVHDAQHRFTTIWNEERAEWEYVR